jgi:hypothetical protein
MNNLFNLLYIFNDIHYSINNNIINENNKIKKVKFFLLSCVISI